MVGDDNLDPLGVGAGDVRGGYRDASYCFGGGKAHWEGGLEDQLGLFVIRGVKIVSYVQSDEIAVGECY